MADFLAAVKTVRKEAERPEPALKEISRTARTTEATSAVPRDQATRTPTKPISRAENPEQALDILKKKPDLASLLQILTQLQDEFNGIRFDLQIPSPRQAQIINAIVSRILPDFWSSLDKPHKSLVVQCLRNVAGISAIIARLRLLAQQGKEKAHELALIYAAARRLFDGDDLCARIWQDLLHVSSDQAAEQDDRKRQMIWKEFLALIASGRVISSIAQTQDCLKDHDILVKESWLSNGVEYAAWLGRNTVRFLARSSDSADAESSTYAAAAQLMTKAFTIGYPTQLVRALTISLTSHDPLSSQASKAWQRFLQMLPMHVRRQLLEHTLRWLSSLAEDQSQSNDDVKTPKSHILAFTASIAFLCDHHESFVELLMEFIQNPVLLSSVKFSIRRAIIAYLCHRKPDELDNLLENLLGTFGDRLFVNHAPALQQESVAQSMLLCAGYVHRRSPMAALMTIRSSGHMQGVSTRLDSTNEKARWLGMVVATALSTLIDKAGSRMEFGTADMLTAEAEWYQGLVSVNDQVGALNNLNAFLKETERHPRSGRKRAPIQKIEELPIVDGKQTFGPPRPPVSAQTEVIGEKVSEILPDDEEDDEDEQLKPHAKPDSDPEDSDEDATLVNRKKAKAPVYIRDLMRMLKDDKDHGRFQMAIKHAAVLIRRKSGFGAEVRDHAVELALMLCDLQDPFNTDDFDELKLQALIAVLLSDVKTIAPWLSRQVFAGEYGLGQRCIMLSALGLGGRELAGFRNQDDLNPALVDPATAFPSKRLPQRLHDIYNPTDARVRRLHAASEEMQHQLIKPLALSAADQTTLHLNAVKVRTFSSRIDVERTKRKPTANELAKIFGVSFFFPLVTRFQQEIAAYGTGSIFTSAPFVLVTFLKTLALQLHAAGPATIDLPEITTAFWDLCLSLRTQAGGDMSVLEAIFFALLTLFEVNGNSIECLTRGNTQQLTRTQQWAEIVFETTGGSEMSTGGSAEETRIRTLAAGVLVKISEIAQHKQKMLMGNLR